MQRLKSLIQFVVGNFGPIGVFYFAATLFGGKSLIQEFAEAQGRMTKEITPDTVKFFKFMTAVWVVYFFVKAGVYAWVAGRYSIEEALLIRGTFGNASFYGMLFISIFGGKYIKQGLLRAGFIKL